MEGARDWGMTRPRRQLPNTLYHLTKRMEGRRCFAVPCKRVSETFRYLLAWAASKTGVEVCAYSLLSNHVHLVILDPLGKRSEFARLLFGSFTVARNHDLGRRGPMWKHEESKASPIVGASTALEQVLYVMNNAVGHRLVRYQADYPGLWSRPEDVEKTEIVRRPAGAHWDAFAGAASLEFRLSMLPGMDALVSVRSGCSLTDAYREKLITDRAEHERRIHARHREENRQRALSGRRPRGYLGRRRVLNTEFGYQPPDDGRPNFSWIALAGDRDVRKRLIAERRAFLRAYDITRSRWRRGNKHALWPPGTYAVVKFYGGVAANTS